MPGLKHILQEKQILSYLKLSVCFLVFLFIQNNLAAQQVANGGILDLSDHSFQHESIVSLNGEWEFYWNEILNNSQIKSKEKKFRPFTKTWNDADNEYSSFGYATYKLTILLPEKYPDLSLQIPDFYSSYELFADGNLIAQNGKVGTSKEDYTPKWIPQNIDLGISDNNRLELILQVANFHHHRGGAYEPLLLGESTFIAQVREKELAFSYILTGALLMGSFFFLGLYLFGKHEKAILFFSLLISVSLSAQTKYLHCGYVLDCIGNEPLEEQTIVVENNVIAQIRSGYLTATDSVEVVNLKSYYVMPGIMDMHVHIEGQSSPTRYSESFRMNPRDVALRSTLYCEKTLMAGVTTVRDLGGSGVNVSLRNAINAGYVKGPRIYTAEKSLATTGGHADPTNGVRDDLKNDPGPKDGVVNSRDEAYKAVRQRYKNGADCIKITATGGVLSVAKDGMGPQFRTEVIKAVVDAANDYGMVTAAHAHGAEAIKMAVKAGVASIEHGSLVDAEGIHII